jgi:hypothetical protein
MARVILAIIEGRSAAEPAYRLLAHQQRGTTVSSVIGGQNALFEGQREITARGMADGAVTSRSNQKHNIISY